jgi:hypothetical protein
MPIGRIPLPRLQSESEFKVHAPRERSKTNIEPLRKANSLADRIALFEKAADTQVSAARWTGRARSTTNVIIAETLPKTPKLSTSLSLAVFEKPEIVTNNKEKEPLIRARSEMSKEPMEEQLQRLTLAEAGLKSVAERLSYQLDAKEARHEEERTEWQAVLAKVVSDSEKEKQRHNKTKFILEAVQKEKGNLKAEVLELQSRLSTKDETIESLMQQVTQARLECEDLQQQLTLQKRVPTIDTSIQVTPCADESTAVDLPPWESSPKLVAIDSSATIMNHDSLLDLKMKRLSRTSSQLGKKQLSRNQSFFSYVPVSTRIVQNFESLLQELESSRSARKPTRDFVKGLEDTKQETEVITVSSF